MAFIRCAEYFYIDAVSWDTAIFVFGDNMKTTECANEYNAYAAIEIMQKLSLFSKENGLNNMSLEEINAEISYAITERTAHGK